MENLLKGQDLSSEYKLSWQVQGTLEVRDLTKNRCTRHKAQTANDALDPDVRPHNPYLLKTWSLCKKLEKPQIEAQLRIMLEAHICAIKNPDPWSLNFIHVDLNILKLGTVLIQILRLGRRCIITSLANMVKIVITRLDRTFWTGHP